MAGIIFYFIFLIIGLYVLYSIIKGAINNSEMGQLNGELRSIIRQQSKQHEETKIQIDELQQLLREQNQLLKDAHAGRS
jgi:cell division protein FtsL